MCLQADLRVEPNQMKREGKWVHPAQWYSLLVTILLHWHEYEKRLRLQWLQLEKQINFRVYRQWACICFITVTHQCKTLSLDCLQEKAKDKMKWLSLGNLLLLVAHYKRAHHGLPHRLFFTNPSLVVTCIVLTIQWPPTAKIFSFFFLSFLLYNLL